jgi:trigger factor
MSNEKTLNVQAETLEDSKIKIQVEVPSTRVQTAEKAVRREVLKHVKIPGFRKDKTPIALVKRHIGAERFEEFVVRELLPQTYYDAVEQEGIRPISEVEYDERELTSNGFKFSAKFAVAPEFTLGDYKTMTVETAEAEEVSDEQVNEFLTNLAKQYAEKQDVEEGAEIKEGNLISVLVKGKIDGEDSKALKHYNVPLTVGENTLYPDFDNHFIGHKKLDRINVTYKFADDYDNKALAGKEAELEIKVLGHQTVEAVELNDEFVQAKLPHYKTLEELKNSIKTELKSRASNDAQEQLRKNIQESLYNITECNVPEGLVKDLTQAKKEDLEQELKYRNTTMEDYLSSKGQTEDEFNEELNKDSERELKLSFALTKVAEQEGMEVTDAEVMQRIHFTAHYLRKNFHDIYEYVEAHGRRILIKSEIMQEKALFHLSDVYGGAEDAVAAENKEAEQTA